MFYDRFIELCKSKCVKPTPLVLKMGLSSSNVSQWKKGSTPRPEVLQKFAEYFNVSVEYLLTGEAQKEKPPGEGELSGIRKEAWDLIEAMDDNTLRKFIKAARAMLEV